MSTATERRAEIGNAVADAMKSLPANEYDFSKVSDAISKAGHDLDEAMCDYRDGNVTRRFVQGKYQIWRDLHRTGGLF